LTLSRITASDTVDKEKVEVAKCGKN